MKGVLCVFGFCAFWQLVLFGNSFGVPGVRGPILSISGNQMHLKIAFDELMIDGGFSYQFDDKKNSSVELSPHVSSDSTIVKVSLDLEDMTDGYEYCSPLHLPGGRDFPGVFIESMPIMAFEMKDSGGLRFYIGSELLGIFIPVDIGVKNAIATFRLRSDRARIGNLSLIGKDDDSKNSGFFFLLNTKGYMEKFLSLTMKKDI